MSDFKLTPEETFKKEEELKKGAAWFLWIALLSIINSIIVMMDGSLNFIIGLGITQIIDSFTIYGGPGSINLDKATGFSLDLLITSVFFLFAYYARQKKSWAFIVGMILYGLDGLLFLPVQDYLGFGFHVFALVMIFKGFQALNVLNKIKTPVIDIGTPILQGINSTDELTSSKEKESGTKCHSCGTDLTGNFNYCTNCGARIHV